MYIIILLVQNKFFKYNFTKIYNIKLNFQLN